MLRKFSLLFFSLFLVGCGSGSGNESNKSAYLKFKPILDKAMLQCPTSKFDPNCSRDYGDFEDFSNKYFYYEGENLVFYMCGEHNRSELRFKDEFYFDDEVNKTLEAIVKVFPETKEMTFIQIHGVYNGLNKPILRVAVYNNVYKLFIFNGEEYIKKEIGNWDDNFSDFKIIAGHHKLYVYKNGKLEINTTIDYPDKCYYKVGVYLQYDGCGTSIFKDIKINF